MKINTDSVKENKVEQEAILLKCIVDEIDNFLQKAMADITLFPKDALTVSGMLNAAYISRAISEAHKTVLKNLYSPSQEKIENWKKSQGTYIPLHGQNGYMYISNKVEGVTEVLAKKTLNAVVMEPEDVVKYDGKNPEKVRRSDPGYVGMTYEQLVTWTPHPEGGLIEKVVLSGGTALYEQTHNIGSHYFSIVVGCAEASRHLEFGVFALMVARLQQKSQDIWKTIIDAPPESRAWPPMATDAVGTMTQLKEESKAIKGNENVVLYFSRLVRRWAGKEPHVPIDEKQAQDLQSGLKKLVAEYLNALLCSKERRLFPGFNQPTGRIGQFIMSEPIEPAEWVSADGYDKKVASALSRYTPLKI